MMNWVYVFLGGGLGSVLRYAISQNIKVDVSQNQFPWATLLSNILSCFIVGIILSLISKNILSDNYKSLFIVGFCGGLSTFSAFSYESLSLVNNNNYLLAGVYIFTSIITGVIAVLFGYKIIFLF